MNDGSIFFKELTDELKPKILFLAKGETLFKQKDNVISIFHIQSGSIQLTRNTIDGTPVILHTQVNKEKLLQKLLCFQATIIALLLRAQLAKYTQLGNKCYYNI